MLEQLSGGSGTDSSDLVGKKKSVTISRRKGFDEDDEDDDSDLM